RLTRGAAGAEADLARTEIGGQEAAVGGRQGGLSAAIGLAIGDRIDGGVLPVDREVGGVVGDGVVVEQPGPVVGSRRGDQVGAARDRLTRGAAGAEADL